MFLDRDGTLLEEAGYLDRLERLVFFPYAIDAVRLLNRAGLPVVIITNQSGIGRGLYEETFVHETHAAMTERLTTAGARIDAYYYCPHHPDATVERYRQDCDCRKPGPGLFHSAARDLDLDLTRSFVVGDKWTDVRAGHAVGARAILVRTGYGASSERAAPAGVAPSLIADNLMSAVSWILLELQVAAR